MLTSYELLISNFVYLLLVKNTQKFFFLKVKLEIFIEGSRQVFIPLSKGKSSLGSYAILSHKIF